MIDEADNNSWATDFHLRRVLNSGHSAKGRFTKLVKGESRTFSTYAPAALATLERLPLPLIRRSIIVRMKMTTSRTLKRVGVCAGDFDVVRRYLVDWAQGRKLDFDPELPKALHNRIGDNWRILISIADACGTSPVGKRWGAIVREVAVRMSRNFSLGDLRLILLGDIKSIFDVRAIDRIAMADLVAALVAMEGQPWAEYRGVNDDQIPRRLTSGIMSDLLRPFGVRARNHRVTALDLHATTEKTTMWGFRRDQFEEAWRHYLRDDDQTTAQVHKFKHLAGG